MARAVSALAAAQDITVAHLTDRFDPATRDVEWMRTLRDEGWVIVSGDTRIWRSPAERAAWHEAGLTAFFLDETWSNRKFWTKSVEIVRWFPIVIETAKACAPGSGFRLPFQGREPKLIYEPTT